MPPPLTVAVAGDTETSGAWLARTVTRTVSVAEALVSLTVRVSVTFCDVLVAAGAVQVGLRASPFSKLPPPELVHS